MATIRRTAPTTITGKAVGPVGYGMLGLTIPWAPIETSVAIKAMKTALDQGANFWNGSLHYGNPSANSLHLLRDYFTHYPHDASKVILSIKGAFTRQSGPDNSPANIRACVTDAISILPPSLKTIDIFECARVDPAVPIETSVRTLAALVAEGKIRGIGLSEASAATIRRAHAVHPVAAVEIELSLFTPDPLRSGIVETCHELGIPIAAYSPVGRGWLTGELRSLDDLDANDFRRNLPRFQPGNFEQNLRLVEAVERVAKRKGVSMAQVALGWVCCQGAIPIPGSRKEARIVENCRPAELSDEDLVELEKLMGEFEVAGERYGGVHEAMLNG